MNYIPHSPRVILQIRSVALRVFRACISKPGEYYASDWFSYSPPALAPICRASPGSCEQSKHGIIPRKRCDKNYLQLRHAPTVPYKSIYTGLILNKKNVFLLALLALFQCSTSVSGGCVRNEIRRQDLWRANTSIVLAYESEHTSCERNVSVLQG